MSRQADKESKREAVPGNITCHSPRFSSVPIALLHAPQRAHLAGIPAVRTGPPAAAAGGTYPSLDLAPAPKIYRRQDRTTGLESL